MARRYATRIVQSAPDHAQLRDSASRLAASSLLVIGMGMAASTQAAEVQEEKTQLPTVKVEDTAIPYKAETMSSPKYTEPLRDTPAKHHGYHQRIDPITKRPFAPRHPQ